jgi:hypothetical protein
MLEGTTNYVPCQALVNGDGSYLIVKNDDLDLDGDATRIWQFFPGDTVRCTTVTETVFEFGGGVLIPVDPTEGKGCIERKMLLATQLVTSTFPERNLHQLIFTIVRNLGELDEGHLEEYESEITQLCSDSLIVQRRHPIVKRWIEANCSKESRGIA